MNVSGKGWTLSEFAGSFLGSATYNALFYSVGPKADLIQSSMKQSRGGRMKNPAGGGG